MIPTSTAVVIEVRPKVADRGVVAAFVTKGSAGEGMPSPIAAAIKSLSTAGVDIGKARELTAQLVDNRRLIIVGLGPAEALTPEHFREAAGAAAKYVRRHRLGEVSLIVPAAADPAVVADALVSGFCLAAFVPLEMKGTATKRSDAGKTLAIKLAVIVDAKQVSRVREAVARTKIIADAQNFARTIASRPGNVINPPTLAKVAQDLAREVGLTVRVLDEKQMAKLGMGGILAVGGGSITPPRMICLEWNGVPGAKRGKDREQARRLNEPVLVVGKSITFDTGGVSIKTAEGMKSMLFDKCGGTTVLGLMYACAKLKIPRRVIGILAAAENHISGTSYRVDDVLNMYDGTTVEVTNTDAEGRIVLADAIAWGVRTYKPASVIDLATLTGACVIALGHSWAGQFANDDSLAAEVAQAGERVGESMWRLPINDAIRDALKSDRADLVNAAGRWGGALTAAAFIEHFVPPREGGSPTPWVHLDIAPVADTEKEMPYYGKGATGWGVRTLVEWVSPRG